MTIAEALGKAQIYLKERKITSPVKEAGILLAYLLNRDISWIYAHPESELKPDMAGRYWDSLQKRGKAMPFQYISNRQGFMSLDFYVDSHCLIPRPETEILVEKALEWLRGKDGRDCRTLDMGTGSGAIAVSLACYTENVMIDALEVSAKALKTALRNAESHGVKDRIRLIHADFLDWEAEMPYTLVLSNPPYIPHGQLKSLMAEVRAYEPQTALDGGRDGLLFYRALADRVNRLLKHGGAMMVEVGWGQAEQVEAIFKGKGLSVTVYADLAGIPRVVRGER